MTLTDEIINFVYDRWVQKNIGSKEEFNEALEEYRLIKPFAPDENIWEVGNGISNNALFITRLVTQYYLTKAFESMKIDLNNVNVTENLDEGNIGTPGRIAKMWCPTSIDDNSELLSGRWIEEPRMASFKDGDDSGEIVWVQTQIRATCSHHVIGFNNNPSNEKSIAVVGYIVKEGARGGISKISRYVRDYASRRMWLQESLTSYIGKKIEEKFKTDSVYVGLFEINHGCSWTRGANDQDANTSTIYKSGEFLKNIDLVPEKYRG